MSDDEMEDATNQRLLLEGVDVDCNTVTQLYDVENDEWFQETIYSGLKWHCVIPFENKINVIDVKFVDYGLKIHSHDTTTKEITVANIPASRYTGRPIGVHERYIYFEDNFNYRINRLNLDDNTFEENPFTFAEKHTDSGFTIYNEVLYNIGSFHSTDDKSFCEACDLDTLEVWSIAPFPVTLATMTSFESEQLPNLTRVSAIGFGDKLYAMDVLTLKCLYVYCPENDEWETITCENPPSLSMGKLAACGGKLVCVDREISIYVYDLETNKWNGKKAYKGQMTSVSRVFTVNKQQII